MFAVTYTARRPCWQGRLIRVMLAALLVCAPQVAHAQSDDAPVGDSMEDAAQRAEEALLSPEVEPAVAAADEAVTAEQPRINLLDLFFKAGYLIYPIVAMSLVVTIFGLERALALRRRRVFPVVLQRGIEKLAARRDGIDPRLAYRYCSHHPSPAARIIRTGLLKTGRPLVEIERAISDSSQREAERLYTNVRPIVLAVTIAPLLGLLGTVWGMIEAFFITASNSAGINRAESLAGGIYVALVTTFAGLAVAIPAAIIAHVFEGRIRHVIDDIEEYVLTVIQPLGRLEGKVRVDQSLRRSRSTQEAASRQASQEGDGHTALAPSAAATD